MVSSNVAPVAAILPLLMLLSLTAAGEECAYTLDFVPYITFQGQRLPNNSFVNITQLRAMTALQCHTDLETCCDNNSGFNGDWFMPNGETIRTDGRFTVSKLPHRIDLMYSGSSLPPSGLYRCDMPTVAANEMGNERQSIYVGLYATNSMLIHWLSLQSRLEKEAICC